MRKKRKGFTLVELLVVIAIIALLMGILMPALARVRALAFRVVCGTNLSGLGKAMLIYANDYDDELPKAGSATSTWVANLPVWNGANRFIAYSLDGSGRGGYVTVSSHFYLLVKYAEVGPKQFLCKGTDTSEFKLPTAAPYDLIDVWDFGPGLDPIKHCSYSYHAAINTPFGLTTASTQPGMAVAADRNPWLDPANIDPTRRQFVWNGTAIQQKNGNALAHGDEGQNVLFMDSHVAFEKRAFCGVQDDNIYTFCAKTGVIQQGTAPRDASAVPLHKEDSLLVNEGEGSGATTIPPTTEPPTTEPPSTKPPGAPPGCFPADTPVWVDGALVQISKVAVGQKVGRLDATDAVSCLQKPVCLKEIESIHEYQGTYDYYDIVLETGNRINVVNTHYFLIASDQWVLVQNLKVGSKLQSLKGPISIKTIAKREVPFTDRLYDLKVKGGDRYFVGKDGVAVRGH